MPCSWLARNLKEDEVKDLARSQTYHVPLTNAWGLSFRGFLIL